MSIATNLTTGPFTGNGSQTAFAFTFTVSAPGELYVVVDGSTISSSLYTVALNADGTGTVTFSVAPANGASVLLVSQPDWTQETLIESEGEYQLSTINAINRRDGVRANWLARVIGKLLPAGWETATARAGKFLSWDASGNAIAVSGTGADSALRTDLAASTGASLVGFKQSGTNTVPATVQSKERQILNAADFVGFDPTGLTASTTAITNAVTEASTRGRTDVMIPKGAKTGALTLPAGTGLVGPSSKATLVSDAAGTYATLTIAGSDVVIENIEIIETAKAGGPTFALTCGTALKERTRIENCNVWSSWKLWEDSGSGSGVHTTTKLRSIQSRGHRGPGLTMVRGFAFVELDHVVIDLVGVAASNYTAFEFSGTGLGAGSGGVILERCDVLGTSGSYANSAQVGYKFTDMAAVRINNTRADTCDSDGFQFTNINGLWFNDVTASLCNGHGMVFTSCTSVKGVLIDIFGRNYLSSPAASKDGLRFVSGCAAVNLAAVTTRDLTGNGINKVAAQAGGALISGHSSFNNTGRGLKTAGSSAFTVSGYQYGGNVAGNYDLGGNFDYLLAGQLNSGAAVSLIGPGPVTG